MLNNVIVSLFKDTKNNVRSFFFLRNNKNILQIESLDKDYMDNEKKQEMKSMIEQIEDANQKQYV